MAKRYPTPDSPDERWYYLEPGQVQPSGPLSSGNLRELLETKKVHKKSIVWRKGMNQWEAIEKVQQLRAHRSFLARLGFGKKAETEVRAIAEAEEV